MFQYLVSSRLIQGGLVFFVLSVSGSLLYSWHVKRTTDKALAQHRRFLQGHPTPSETRPAVDTQEIRPVDFGETGTSSESDASQDADDTEPSDDVAFDDLADAFLPDDVVLSEEPAEDVPVSPYGFGAYPEIPEGAPIANFDENDSAEMELMLRVAVKKWNEGHRFIGAVIENGKVYLNYPNTIYAKHATQTDPDGEPFHYYSRVLGAVGLTPEQMERGETPPGVKVIDFDSEGLDPYEVLGFSR